MLWLSRAGGERAWEVEHAAHAREEAKGRAGANKGVASGQVWQWPLKSVKVKVKMKTRAKSIIGSRQSGGPVAVPLFCIPPVESD